MGDLGMAETSTDQYAAGEQDLGYIYQPRFGLLKLLQLPESTSILIEKDDGYRGRLQARGEARALFRHVGVLPAA